MIHQQLCYADDTALKVENGNDVHTLIKKVKEHSGKKMIDCKIDYKKDQNKDRTATELHFGMIISNKGTRSQIYVIDSHIGNNTQML